ncbi:mediator of RNA polymerase II transcription subunit 15 [Drosophila elegans]|uniref:mediator of RNA polymerase II transcription subunit 15 n=1 Tax=Drosophila elegans TaxID=30023 RepID=UPI0007E6C1D2|nr:mediator of RNA polymerase II transcription subunit 15 [Drosophila elegans]
MKQFVVLMCLAALTAAAPQGYKYQPQLPALPIGNLRPQTPLSPSGIYSGAQVGVQVQQPAIQTVQTIAAAPAPAPAPVPAAAPLTLSLPIALPQQQLISTVQHQQQQQQQQQQPQQIVYQQPQLQQQIVQTQYVQRPAIVTKDIYIHSAPEETEELRQDEPQLESVPIRKNYRIVFIKAPSQNLKHTAAALKRAQSSNEEKTVIYVLSKKPDLAEIQQQLQVTQSEAKVHKPEVYFIKYKTQEEAQRAQQEIQAQYDALGGATHISDEGVAPITSVSSGSLNLGSFGQQQQPQVQTIVQPQVQVQLPVQQQSSFVQQSTSFATSVPSRKYVPAKTFK